MQLLAQGYRDLYERMRVMLQRELSSPSSRPRTGGQRGASPPAVPKLQRHYVRRVPDDWLKHPLDPEQLTFVRRTFRGLLEQQGELGRRLTHTTRHRLFQAGGEAPRKIVSRMAEVADRCHSLRLSSEGMVRGTTAGISTSLDDLCQLNSHAGEDLLRFGQDLRSRGDAMLAGHSEARRYLRGEAWRRPSY